MTKTIQSRNARMVEPAAFTDDELAFGEQHTVLGPAYKAAQDSAEKFMAGFEAEHFKPLIEKFADDFRDKLWDDLKDYLLVDVESNLQGDLWRSVDATINALLTGQRWALNRYVLAQERYGEAPQVRAAIAGHCGDEIQAQRIAELEEEVAKLTERNRQLSERSW